MLESQNIHELKSLQGKLAYLRRFIWNLVGRFQPFGHLMKKGTPFNWKQTCSDAIRSIKLYLVKPSILVVLYLESHWYSHWLTSTMVPSISTVWDCLHPSKNSEGTTLSGFVYILNDRKLMNELPDLMQCLMKFNLIGKCTYIGLHIAFEKAVA